MKPNDTEAMQETNPDPDVIPSSAQMTHKEPLNGLRLDPILDSLSDYGWKLH
jgi:hypothetical protein